MEEIMEFFKAYWPIIASIVAIVWHLIQQYFEFQRTKERIISYEKQTTDYLTTFEKNNLDRIKLLEDQVSSHRKELDREIALAREKAEKDMLKSKDEINARMDKLFEKLDTLIISQTELKTGFDYIKEAIDDLKGK